MTKFFEVHIRGLFTRQTAMKRAEMYAPEGATNVRAIPIKNYKRKGFTTFQDVIVACDVDDSPSKETKDSNYVK